MVTEHYTFDILLQSLVIQFTKVGCIRPLMDKQEKYTIDNTLINLFHSFFVLGLTTCSIEAYSKLELVCIELS